MNDWRQHWTTSCRTDPRDVGCEQAMEMLHVYVELVAAGGSGGAAVPGHRGAPARRVRPVRRKDFEGTAGRGCAARRPGR